MKRITKNQRDIWRELSMASTKKRTCLFWLVELRGNVSTKSKLRASRRLETLICVTMLSMSFYRSICWISLVEKVVSKATSDISSSCFSKIRWSLTACVGKIPALLTNYPSIYKSCKRGESIAKVIIMCKMKIKFIGRSINLQRLKISGLYLARWSFSSLLSGFILISYHALKR